MGEEIFVLDIGTRSVVALLASKEQDELSVSHMLYKEHKLRAMMDGQIHHVDQVAEIITELVREMTELSGRELRKVAVAAAGRSLTTVKGIARHKYQQPVIVSPEELMTLELMAVQEAQASLPKKYQDKTIPLSQQYYCVGYSVVREALDGIRLGSIIGQKGQETELEVVATFLPRIVVESLQNAVQQAGLELCSITLEPIAVSNLVLNQSMRRLNLVLVDIGAGTADIAVCSGDAINAYGMVPLAGDEITETISDSYLLDFNRAEEVKRQLETAAEIVTVDVMGIDQIYQSAEIRKTIQQTVDNLAAAIAMEIMQLNNNKAPQAVLLVGGGSLTPGLPAALSRMIEMPGNRIVVQQAGRLQQVRNLPEEFHGPAFITVLGIAFTYLNSPTMGFINLEINGEPVQLLQLAQNTIAEALLAAGHNLKDIYGRPGLALTCEVNGKLCMLPGKPGKPGRVVLNGAEASFGDKIKSGDVIEFEPGLVGEEGNGTFRDLLQDALPVCYINGREFPLSPVITEDDKIYSLDDAVRDGCSVKIQADISIREVLDGAGIVKSQPKIWINNREIQLTEFAALKKNGLNARPEDKVGVGDVIEFDLPQLLIRELLPVKVGEAFEVVVNGQKVPLRKNEVLLNGEPADLNTPVKPGDKIEYTLSHKNFCPILIDVFKEIDISTEPPEGKSKLLLLVNEEEKQYTTELKHGDKIQVEWV